MPGEMASTIGAPGDECGSTDATDVSTGAVSASPATPAANAWAALGHGDGEVALGNGD